MGVFFFFSTSFSAIALPLLVAIFYAVHACPPSDREALLALSSSLKEPYLGIFDSWKGTDCCSNWYGISCDPTTHRVTDVSLRGESEDPILQKTGRSASGFMSGSINPSICQLDRLTTFIIADWKGIAGEIPQCVASLPNLRVLDLIGNSLSGKIPEQIGNLQKLTVLNLADNKISGEIPSSIGNKYRLADLDLSKNKIWGQIPQQLGKMRVLSTLNLDSNMISGEIPSVLLANTGVGILNLSRNSLEGNIPDVFGPNSYYMALDLSFNKLKGPVPGSISSAKYVGHLDLSHNHLCGTIPVGSPFDHLEASSFESNDCLCGNPLKTC